MPEVKQLMNKWSQDSHPGLPDSLCPAHACAHVFSALHRSQMGLGSGCTIPPQGPPYTHFTLALTPACWGFGLQSTAPSAWGLWASRLPSFASEGGDNEGPASCEEHRWSCRGDSAPLFPLLMVQTWHRIHPRSGRDGEMMEGLAQYGVCSFLVRCPPSAVFTLILGTKVPLPWAVGQATSKGCGPGSRRGN